MGLELVSEAKVFGGWHRQYRHQSQCCQCAMRFAVFLPEQASAETPVPSLYWLSGLTCTDENFMQKAGAFRSAAAHGIALIAPDTSPRGDEVADDDNYDLGQGAGFYVNATQMPWRDHFQMYDYVTSELPALVEAHLPLTGIKSVSGHSMGGHGALVVGLSLPEQYKSISAFSPIANPINCPWGRKALSSYLGDNEQFWLQYDAVNLIGQKTADFSLPILIDQGDADSFLAEQLKPDTLVAAAQRSGVELTLRMQPGYDHSYYFIASFIDDHIAFHSRYLTD